MEFPLMLKQMIEQLLEQDKPSDLKSIAAQLSQRYRSENKTGQSLLSEDKQAAVYAAVRMPATFTAVSSALFYALEEYHGTIDSLLDVGAGCGAASWAANQLLSLKSITCLEREKAMRTVGEALMKQAGLHANWIDFDLSKSTWENKADLVIASYVLNEMNEQIYEEAIMKLWNMTDKMLLIVEPGTPEGFELLKNARKQLLKVGAHLAAPCPHEQPCRLSSDDWCHFTCRVQRSRLHKLLKEGDAPYEDEKYSYMAFVKEENHLNYARILRHPQIDKGCVSLQLCCENENKRVCIRKKDREQFKKARKASCGDSFEI